MSENQHDWKAGETEKAYYPLERNTVFHCQKCKIMFRHFYNATPDFKEAMQKLKVPVECKQ